MKHELVRTLSALLMLVSGCGSDGGKSLSDAAADATELDEVSPDSLDSTNGDVDTEAGADRDGDTDSSVGWIGRQTFVAGASPPQAEEAIATTDTGWAVLVNLGREALTVSTDGRATTLDPGLANNNRLAILPIDTDGIPGSPIEVARTSGLLANGALTRCGDHLWGAATTSDSRESWVFRVRTDLSEIAVARFVGTGTDTSGDYGLAQIWSVQCASTEAAFVVRLTGGMQVIPPAGAAIDVPSVQSETWLLVDGVLLFEAGRFEHIGDANVAIDSVRPGRGHTVIYAAYDVNGAVQVARTRILRHDFASGVTTPFFDIDLPTNVFRPVFAEALDTEGSSRVAGLCARYQGVVQLGDLEVSDPLASDFCVSLQDGHPISVRTFRNIVPSDVAVLNGLFWLSGSLTGTDPTLGSATTQGELTAFLAGLDAANLEVRSIALLSSEGRDAVVRSVMRASGQAQCADQVGVAMEVGNYERATGYFAPTLELVMAGISDTACTNRIAAVDGDALSGRPALFSPFNQRSCNNARRLAIVPPGLALSVASQTTIAGTGQDRFSLVVFGPQECSITAP